jgi:3-phenylpropionate/trans-cinnamate dioxygenase ferredoxin reductase component
VLVTIERVVIVGAGLAGLRTIEELRARGYPGEITLIGAETHPPYDRPPLSKKVMTGELDNTSLRANFTALAVTFHPAETATALTPTIPPNPAIPSHPDSPPHPSASPNPATASNPATPSNPATASNPATPSNPAVLPHPDGPTQLNDPTRSGGPTSLGGPREPGGVVRTERGEHRYDRLVLATGATPVTLPGTGRQRVLRSIDDALELRGLLEPGLKLVVAGAGWIGAELATAAAARGCDVTVLDLAAAPLAAAVGPEVGMKTAAWYAAAGVRLLLGQGVESVEPGGLALAGGGWLAADEVVTAVGVRPAVTWLDGSGVRLESGVATDAGLRTSVPGVFAVGDCASFESRRYGRRLRFEHWDVALHAPEVVAANLLGGDESYDPVPYFWSEQFGRMLQYVGYHGGADQMIWRGDPDSDAWTACWLTAGRLVALLAVDRPRDLVQARRLITAASHVDPTKLADPAIPIRSTALPQ